ncbi:MAG: fasciclin domain-containing protein [Ramlibacter sp.]
MNRRLLVLVPILAALAACATQPMSNPVSVADTIAREPQLSTLNGLVQRAGLAETLKGPGPYTVFAPTNEAFKEVPAKTMDELSRDPAMLKAVLAYHVVPAKLMAADVTNSKAKTSQGANLELAKAGGFVTVEDAMVQTADITATNGVVHTVDRVLMPPKAH